MISDDEVHSVLDAMLEQIRARRAALLEEVARQRQSSTPWPKATAGAFIARGVAATFDAATGRLVPMTARHHHCGMPYVVAVRDIREGEVVDCDFLAGRVGLDDVPEVEPGPRSWRQQPGLL